MKSAKFGVALAITLTFMFLTSTYVSSLHASDTFEFPSGEVRVTSTTGRTIGLLSGGVLQIKASELAEANRVFLNVTPSNARLALKMIGNMSNLEYLSYRSQVPFNVPQSVLRSLKSLSVESPFIPHPSSLGKDLEELELKWIESDNDSSWDAPSLDFSGLSFPNLTRFSTIGVEINGVEFIADCPKVEYFDLSSTPASDDSIDLSIFRELSRVSEIRISGVSISDIGPLSGINSLKNLSLVNCCLKDICDVIMIPHLEYGDFRENLISSISCLSSVNDGRRLKIDLRNNPVIQDKAISEVIVFYGNDELAYPESERRARCLR